MCGYSETTKAFKKTQQKKSVELSKKSAAYSNGAFLRKNEVSKLKKKSTMLKSTWQRSWSASRRIIISRSEIVQVMNRKDNLMKDY